jgi:hypothetical protein
MRTLSTTVAAAILTLSFFCPGISLAGMNRMTDEKLFRLELELEPTQPVVGTNAAVLIVTDAGSNRVVDDAVIELIPWMTMHSHGSPKKPEIKKTGDGRYRIENLYYTMEGDWDLIVTIRNGDSKDTTTFPIVNVKKK